MKNTHIWMIALIMVNGFAASACGAEPQLAPEYSARVLGSEQEATLASLRGQVVLLNAWATWCPPCREEMPDFEAIYTSYKEQGLAVVGVNIDEGEADDEVIRYVQGMKIGFSIWRDPNNRFGKRFRVLGVPATLLINREGMIVRRWQGPMDPGAADNLKTIKAALGSAPASIAANPQAQDGELAAVRRGRRLADQRGCLTCHSSDGTQGMGPSWKGLAGSTAQLTDGRSVLRDRAYLTRAIVDPDVEIVTGYSEGMMAGAMPGKRLSKIEVETLVRYLESLSQ
ncbi:redoxin domain-containing protein [Methyloprofundus sedimenti]|nr:redoxin domain-containing protein [Methyloprofundus sedimenti]